MSGRPSPDCQSVYAPRSAPSAGATSERSSVGSFWRESASATGPPSRSSAIRHAIDVSFASPGRTYQRFGIDRSVMWCSTGWWVGPSSPRPTESCVQTQSDCMWPSAESRTAGRM